MTRRRGVMLVGGPWHGRWVTADPAQVDVVVAEPAPLPAVDFWSADLAVVDMPRQVVYTRRKLLWPGWRFPVEVFVAPGVTIEQGAPDAWVNPLVGPHCRCVTEYPLGGRGSPVRRLTGVPSSACHLDHCLVHETTPERRAAETLLRDRAAVLRALWLSTTTGARDRLRPDPPPGAGSSAGSYPRHHVHFAWRPTESSIVVREVEG